MIFLVNFKNYKQGIGKSGFKILEAMERAAKEFPSIDFISSPSTPFLISMKRKADKVQVFSQHSDPVPLGAYTGHIPPKLLKEININGTLINHSEKQLKFEKIKNVIEMGNTLDLTVCACAPTPDLAGKLANIQPDYIAYEPPELIGTDTSVSEAKPKLLSESVKTIKNKSDGLTQPLCGAGIKGPKDVRKAIKLGVKGILIASGIIKAEKPYKKLKELATPMIN